MAAAIIRSRLSASADPNSVLGSLLGPAFQAYRRAFEAAESGRRPEIPLHLDVDVTTACNLRCPMCPAGNERHIFPGFKKGRFLDRPLYRAALAEGRGFGLPSIRLGMTGEPLLIRDIEDWAEEAREAGVLDISLITNGAFLTPEKSRALIKAGLSRLMISVDAGSDNAYARVRPGGDWAMLLNNITAFRRIRAEMRSKLPLLRISFVEMSLNCGESEKFQEIFEPLADYLSFQRYQNILGRSETDFLPKQSCARQGRALCTEPLTRLALHVDGSLFPCCSDFGRLKPIGHINSGGLLATWKSQAAEALAGRDGQQAEPCRSCLAG